MQEERIHSGSVPVLLRGRWIAAGVAVAALVAVFGVGIYRFRWDGAVTRIVTEVVPYPAALVEGRVVRYAEFQEDVRVLERFYEEARKEAVPGAIFPSPEEIRDRVLDRLIKDRLAVELAGRYGIVITTEDVNEAYETTILDQAALGTASGKARAEARASKTLDELYGLRPSQFKTRILHPFLVRQKLEEALRKDDTVNAEKIRKAEAAAAELKAGKDFKQVALAYSEDPNVASTGGDRGMIGRGLLPAEVEEAAFRMRPGEISGVIRSALGYHVVMVSDRREQGGEVTKVGLKEILVRPIRLDDYLEAQEKTASIVTFVQ
jgi:parvulin-like peptidyl-prolyl isomerase